MSWSGSCASWFAERCASLKKLVLNSKRMLWEPEDALEAILSAPSVTKSIRSTSRGRTSARETLYVIVGVNFLGIPIYTKGQDASATQREKRSNAMPYVSAATGNNATVGNTPIAPRRCAALGPPSARNGARRAERAQIWRAPRARSNASTRGLSLDSTHGGTKTTAAPDTPAAQAPDCAEHQRPRAANGSHRPLPRLISQRVPGNLQTTGQRPPDGGTQPRAAYPKDTATRRVPCPCY